MTPDTPFVLSRVEPLPSNVVRRFFSCFFKPETLYKSFKVALVVGPILISINYFDVLIQGRVTWLCAAKIGLTFLVPFCVSGYATATTLMAQCCQED
jgi:hypothetical protein